VDADVRLRNGVRLRGTGTVLCARAGRLIDVDVRDLVVGDWVALSYDPQPFPTQRVPLAVGTLSRPYGSQKPVRVPDVLDADLALLLGMYASEGHTTRATWTVVITNSVPSVLTECVALWERCFGLSARITRQGHRCPSVVASSKTVVEVMESLGCGSRARTKRIPAVVMDSPRDVVVAFLRGLWLDAYATTARMPKWALCLDSPALLDDLQTLLRRLGVVTGRSTKYNPQYDKCFDEVYAVGRHAQRLIDLVPFLEPDKAAAADRLRAAVIDPRRNGADVVPLVHGSVLYAEMPKGTGGRSGAGTGVARKWRSLSDKRTVWPSRWTIEQVASSHVRLPYDVQRVVDEHLHFSPVQAIAWQPGGTCPDPS
jgi:hypothetical protein